MNKYFEEPTFEVVHFNSSVITASGCGCNVGGYDFGAGQNSTCTGGNVSCSCNPNYDDPSANCEDPDE